jgi:SAM-dependent methyltransferase
VPTAKSNWFESGGQGYEAFRPRYPETLAQALAALPARTELAVDVGCGTGQLTVRLAPLFDATVGVDPSADQLAHARAHERIRYVRAPAEALPVPDGAADLVTAAQAAHWFDLPAFYDECRRVAAPGAVLALVAYGMLHLDDAVDERFQRFYSEDLHGYWPPERALVDEAYRTVEFPFEELAIDPLTISRAMTLDDVLGYVSTWSAARALAEAGHADVLDAFARELAEQWADPARTRVAVWPITARIGLLRT